MNMKERQHSMNTIILASTSPRRKDLLTQIGLPFRIIGRPINEDLLPGESAEEMAARLAQAKARRVGQDFRTAPAWIVGADTVVFDEEGIYGKANDLSEARRFLRRLSGKTHRVVTAVSLVNGHNDTVTTDSDVTKVSFAELSDEEIEWYLGTNEWQGVAGAYRVQGRAACFVEELHGSYSTVMGLPIRTLYSILKHNQYPFPQY